MIITNTQNNSFTQPISTSRGTSDNWNSNYTSFNAQSAANASVYTTVNTNSASWIVDGGNTRNNNIKIGTNDNFNLALETNGVDRITISNTGNVGVGDNLPGQRLTVSGNISALSGIYHIGNPQGVIPVYLTVANINLLAAVGTRTAIYSVPAGMVFTGTTMKLIITSSNQTGVFTTGPSLALTRSDTNKMINDVTLSNLAGYGAYAVGDIASSVNSVGVSNAHRTYSADTVGISIAAGAYSGGTFSGAPNLVATAIVTGELIYL